jgi:nucleoside-diphosphate kinase
LKRSESKTVTQRDLYIGSVVTVLARQLKLTDYADVSTRKKFEVERGKYLSPL